MPDLTQPATAAEFQAAGADAATAASLAMQHNMMTGRAGTPDQRIELAVGMRNQPPAAKLAPPASTVTPAQATAALAAHNEVQLSHELDAVMAPPAAPGDYLFPHSLEPENEAAFAADNELRAALHSEGLPRHIVESIGSSLAQAASTRINEDQAQARIGSTRATLERWYGKDTDANLAHADALFERLRAKGGATADFVEAVAPHLDALSLDALIQFAKHKAGRR